MSDAQKAKIEASKAAGRADNYAGGGMPHSAVAGRQDAAWSSVTSGAPPPGMTRSSSVEGHRKDLRGDLDAILLVFLGALDTVESFPQIRQNVKAGLVGVAGDTKVEVGEDGCAAMGGAGVRTSQALHEAGGSSL